MKTKRLPNFLCIGAPRSGTSWMYELLKFHPQIFFPTHIKETEFFRSNYSKGLEWYNTFFDNEKSMKAKIKGEITPSYLFSPQARHRIFNTLGPSIKILIILRNPKKQFLSVYNKFNDEKIQKIPLENYLNTGELPLLCASFSIHLERWFDLYGEKNIHITIYEELIKDPQKELFNICDFLEVKRIEFPKDLLGNKVNQSNAYKFRILTLLGIRLSKFLKSIGLYKFTYYLEKMGKKILIKKKVIKKINSKENDLLNDIFKIEIEKCERILKRKIPSWDLK